MPLKEKFLGAVLIILGALPFLTKIEAIKNIKFISYLNPGQITYQIILILIGILLIWSMKPRQRMPR